MGYAGVPGGTILPIRIAYFAGAKIAQFLSSGRHRKRTRRVERDGQMHIIPLARHCVVVVKPVVSTRTGQGPVWVVHVRFEGSVLAEHEPGAEALCLGHGRAAGRAVCRTAEHLLHLKTGLLFESSWIIRGLHSWHCAQPYGQPVGQQNTCCT